MVLRCRYSPFFLAKLEASCRWRFQISPALLDGRTLGLELFSLFQFCCHVLHCYPIAFSVYISLTVPVWEPAMYPQGCIFPSSGQRSSFQQPPGYRKYGTPSSRSSISLASFHSHDVKPSPLNVGYIRRHTSQLDIGLQFKSLLLLFFLLLR